MPFGTYDPNKKRDLNIAEGSLQLQLPDRKPGGDSEFDVDGTKAFMAGFDMESTTLTDARARLDNANSGEFDDTKPFDLQPEHLAGYEEFADAFIDVDTELDYQIVKAQIDADLASRKIIELSSEGGRAAVTAGAMVGGILTDPTTYLTAGAFGALAKAGKLTTTGRRIGAAGAIGATGAGVAEVILHAEHPTRTLAESAFNITGAAVITAALGPLIFRSPAAAKRVIGEIDDSLKRPVLSSVGAAAATGVVSEADSLGRTAAPGQIDLFDEAGGVANDAPATIQGGKIGTTGDDTPPPPTPNEGVEELRSAPGAGKWSPNIATRRINDTESVTVARDLEDLVGRSDLSQGVVDGTRVNVVDTVAGRIRAREIELEAYKRNVRQGFKAAKKEAYEQGVKLSRKQYNEAISRVLDTGQPSGIKAIDDMAGSVREFFAKYRDDLIVLGKIGDETDAKVIDNYLSRIVNREMLTSNSAKRAEFESLVAEALMKANVGKTISKLQAELEKALAAGKADEVAKLRDDIANASADGQKTLDDLATEDAYVFREDAQKIVSNYLDSKNVLGVEPLPDGIAAGSKFVKPREILHLFKDPRFEQFFIRDINEVMTRYSQSIAPEVEMLEKFGTANPYATGSVKYNEIRAHYDELKRMNPQRANELEKKFHADIQALNTVVDRLKGTAAAKANATNPTLARMSRVLRQWNFLTMLQEVGYTSFFSDLFKPVFESGLYHATKGFAGTSAAFVSAAFGGKLGRVMKADAERFGALLDLATHERTAAMADIWHEGVDSYKTTAGRAVGQGVDSLARFSGKMTGLNHWNSFIKSVAANAAFDETMTIAGKLARGEKVSKPKLITLADRGLSPEDAVEMYRRWEAAGGQKIGGLHLANFDAWADDTITRKMIRSQNRISEIVIVTPGQADLPKGMDSWLWKTVLQFKSFLLSSYERSFRRGVQRTMTGSTAPIQGFALMMAAAYAKEHWYAQLRGTEVPKDPMTLAWSVLDGTGLLPMMEFGNILDRSYQLGLNSPARYQNRSPFSDPTMNLIQNVAGPSAGQIVGAADTLITGPVEAALGEDGFDKRNADWLARNIPLIRTPAINMLPYAMFMQTEYTTFEKVREALRNSVE